MESNEVKTMVLDAYFNDETDSELFDLANKSRYTKFHDSLCILFMQKLVHTLGIIHL